MRISAGTIAVVVVLLGWVPLHAAETKLRVCVRDESGSVVPGAVVQVQGDAARRWTTEADGCVRVNVPEPQARVVVTRTGFDESVEPIGGRSEVSVTLRIAARSEAVEVTATRTPLALDASASSVRTMSTQQLEEAPSLTLDERLRQVAGFQLFRRTSSWVANPTTEGTSLRGLGSTAASRTLVLSDLVPLNDSFGGWIHWNEIPQLAMSGVELMRGGASDLYGSSAIGGVIDVMAVTPEQFGYAADLSGANEATSNLSGLLECRGQEIQCAWSDNFVSDRWLYPHGS